MSDSSNSTTIAITVAVIGLIGTLGAALIGNWGGEDSGEGAGPPPPPVTVPHAPAIEVNSATEMWGEDTKLIDLAPGARLSLDARNLYSASTTFPPGSCLGPEYVAYTWQVRDPYPQGGDLEILRAIPRAGGRTEQIAMGAKGRGTMLPCDEHIFKNNGLQSMRVEVRYASAIEQLPGIADAAPEATTMQEGQGEAADAAPEPLAGEVVDEATAVPADKTALTN